LADIFAHVTRDSQETNATYVSVSYIVFDDSMSTITCLLLLFRVFSLYRRESLFVTRNQSSRWVSPSSLSLSSGETAVRTVAMRVAMYLTVRYRTGKL